MFTEQDSWLRPPSPRIITVCLLELVVFQMGQVALLGWVMAGRLWWDDISCRTMPMGSASMCLVLSEDTDCMWCWRVQLDAAAGVNVLPCLGGPSSNLDQDNSCPGKLLVFPHPVLGSIFSWVATAVFCIRSYSSWSSDHWAVFVYSNGIIKLTTKKMMTKFLQYPL
jgi:hypothetical protein